MLLVFWKKVNNYLVSSEGEIKNIKSDKHVKFLTRGKFLTAELRWKCESKTFRVDELVAELFIRPPRPGEILEHIDGDFKNNREENLKWTPIETYLSLFFGAKWKLIEDKTIKGTYYISSQGEIWSKSSEELLSTRVHSGYPAVSIGYQFRHVHVLVAKAFVPNKRPELYDIVNHIDENVLNCTSDNLEWCTNQYNSIYSLEKTGRAAPRKNKKIVADKGGIEFVNGYLVYRNGRIYSKKSSVYLLTQPNGGGYPRVEIKGKKQLVHLIVANAFLDPPPDNDDFYEIDHVNGNKTDNSVENLEWVTRSVQMKRCVKSNPGSFTKTQKPVVQLTFDGEIVETFPGIKEAARKTNINSGSIVKACKGVRPSAGGFHWKYKLEISP